MMEAVSSDICIHAMSGFAGLRPALAAVRRFPRIGLANKETIVAAGSLVMRTAAESGCEIIPIDSEHSAIFQVSCRKGMHGYPTNFAYLFGRSVFWHDGGRACPCYGRTGTWASNVENGAKITIDCATLMNKGLEVIEALHLFHVAPEQIEVIIHRESIIHSMVEYNDRAVIAQLGVSDMRLPIQYAITYPERIESPCRPLSLTE